MPSSDWRKLGETSVFQPAEEMGVVERTSLRRSWRENGVRGGPPHGYRLQPLLATSWAMPDETTGGSHVVIRFVNHSGH
jgi:hypothetical protein